MAIKVKIPTGETEARLSALYQWDYGQVLEIEAQNLPTLVEVHFACRDMTEAVVHVCSTALNVATVTIPDQCLEHTGEITAWVYEIDGTSGRTLYRITIPIIARARPARGESIPVTVEDTYTQLITKVNEAMGNLSEGTVIVSNATHATMADRATQADNASAAAYATSAGSAGSANRDGSGNDIVSTYQPINRGGWTSSTLFDGKLGTVYQFCVFFTTSHEYELSTVVTYRTSGVPTHASLGYGYLDDVLFYFILTISGTGAVSVSSVRASDGFPMGELTDVTIMFRKI